jgi:hypothetical protein
LVLVVIATVTAGIVVLKHTGSPNSCSRGKDLERARLLHEAELAFADADGRCGTQGSERVQRAQAEADVAAAVAETQLATARRLKQTARQHRVRSQRIRSRRRARERAARRALIASVAADPFRPNAQADLDGVLERVPIARTVAAREKACARAVRLVGNSLPDQAEIAISRAGRRGFRTHCREAMGNLVAARRQARGELQAAQAVQEKGDESAARAHYADALSFDPSLAAARAALENPADEASSNLDRISNWLEAGPAEINDELIWILPLLALVAVVGFHALRGTASISRGSRKGMESVSKRFPLRWMRRTCKLSVRVPPFEGGSGDGVQGADISALLISEIWRRRSGEGSTGADYNVTSVAQDRVAQASDILDELPQGGRLASAMLSLLGSVFESTSAELSGRLLPAGRDGAGLALTLTSRRKSTPDAIAIWEQDIYDDSRGKGADGWYRLVPPAGLWAAQYLETHLPGEPRQPAAPGQWLADARSEPAQLLKEDDLQLPAAYNVALQDLREERYGKAIKSLEYVLAALNHNPGLQPRWPGLREWVMASLAVALHYRANEISGQPETRARLRAVEVSQDLVEALAESAGKDGVEAQNTPPLRSAVVMLASMTVRADTDQCRDAAKVALDEEAVHDSLSRVALADGVRELPAADLIHRFVLVEPITSTQTNYNLACYFTALAKCASNRQRARLLGDALERMRASFADPELVEWAQKDPSLELLRTDARLNFFKLVRSSAGSEQSDN